ncbi:hypothetical protein H5J25_05615 [Sphingomonas aliaeris]|uniref:Uncharacterized protein n=2 Tax=Sphingomonas aliaeris TaxID=2759526 RepID=A0A974NXR8_9SPHN|nr:hypothetical protein H5J25_05615 [Sphingomonas aliaeris]
MLAAIAAVSTVTPAFAKEKPPVFVVTAPVKDKPVVTIDPAKAYILLRSDNPVPLYLMKVPTAEDQALYDKTRAAAFVEARQKYEKKQASYLKAKAEAVKTPGLSVPEEPVEPTDANFEFVPFEMLASVGIGPTNRLSKSKDVSTYLQEVTPGTYRVYGQMLVMNGTAGGSCFCMGSVKFDAPAGKIVDLGVIDKADKVEKVSGDSSQPVLIGEKPLFRSAGPGETLDPRIINQTVVAAKFMPVGKLPNYFGLTITRIPEMSGVFRYDRDRMIDLTTGS